SWRLRLQVVRRTSSKRNLTIRVATRRRCWCSSVIANSSIAFRIAASASGGLRPGLLCAFDDRRSHCRSDPLPSPPAEQATAGQDQAGKASPSDGTRYGSSRLERQVEDEDSADIWRIACDIDLNFVGVGQFQAQVVVERDGQEAGVGGR